MSEAVLLRIFAATSTIWVNPRRRLVQSVRTQLQIACIVWVKTGDFEGVDEAVKTVRWYAIRTRPRHEKMAALMLENKGYKTFLPLYTRKSSQGRRHQEDIHIPIFPGYLFSCFDESIRLPILTTPGVLYVVGVGRIPSPIEDEEIDAIRRVMCSPWPVEPWAYLKTGDQVYVDRGPLRGLRGKLVAVKNGYRIVLTVELLRRAVAVEIDSDAIVPIGLPAPVLQPVR